MLVAALDSTAVTATAAIAEITDGELKNFSLFTCKNKMTHSETLLPMLENALNQFGAKAEDIDLFCVSAGPGSFTGVRIGVATVKGLAFASGKPCVAVSALEALAENIKYGKILPLMDAKRNQFYVSYFEDGKRIWDDCALSAEEIYEKTDGGEGIIICGDGARVFKDIYPESKYIIAPAASIDQNALSVAVTGYRLFTEGKSMTAAEIQPVYLRKPQAEREREEREAKKGI